MADIIATPKAPAAIGPYVQAQALESLVFVSGQLGMDLNGNLPATFAGQTRQALENLTAILEQAGSNRSRVVKTTVFLSDLANFAELNTIYAEYFKTPYPARSCFQVARLPKDAMVEIEATATR